MWLSGYGGAHGKETADQLAIEGPDTVCGISKSGQGLKNQRPQETLITNAVELSTTRLATSCAATR
jgi:hypothetical protein